MAFRFIESSSDVVAEADGATPGDVLVGLAQAFTHVTTAGGGVEPRMEQRIRVESKRDPAHLAVAFVNELVFLFSTKAFLPHGGEISVAQQGEQWVAEGTLRGDAFDPQRHRFGTEVKAATMHEPLLETGPNGARGRVLLDL